VTPLVAGIVTAAIILVVGFFIGVVLFVVSFFLGAYAIEEDSKGASRAGITSLIIGLLVWCATLVVVIIKIAEVITATT